MDCINGCMIRSNLVKNENEEQILQVFFVQFFFCQKQSIGDSQELILERYKLYILAFFLPKIVLKERSYCEKQSGIIVIYLNVARTYNSVTFVCLFVCLQNT